MITAFVVHCLKRIGLTRQVFLSRTLHQQEKFMGKAVPDGVTQVLTYPLPSFRYA